MKIDLQGPYSLLWSWGGLYEQPNGRKVVFLSNSRTNKTTISYAKYLMTVKLNRLLEENELVGHKDEDVTNDSIDNLVLTTKAEVSAKTNKRRTIGRTIQKVVSHGISLWGGSISGVQQQR